MNSELDDVTTVNKERLVLAEVSNDVDVTVVTSAVSDTVDKNVDWLFKLFRAVLCPAENVFELCSVTDLELMVSVVEIYFDDDSSVEVSVELEILLIIVVSTSGVNEDAVVSESDIVDGDDEDGTEIVVSSIVLSLFPIVELEVSYVSEAKLVVNVDAFNETELLVDKMDSESVIANV